MTIHDERELAKIMIGTFPMDLSNNFDYSADEVIKKLKDDNKKSEEDYKHLEDLPMTNPEWYKELSEIAEQAEVNLDQQSAGYQMDIIYRTEEIQAFMEMKIVYAFRHLEINLKRLVKFAFENINVNSFFRWENIETFLKSRNINFQQIDRYTEVNQLRMVNNSIKHNIEFIEEIKRKIPEFKHEKHITYTALSLFYERIKKAPNLFLTALSGEIYSELFKFNESKIDSVAKEFVKRMDKAEAEKFAAKLLSYYR